MKITLFHKNKTIWSFLHTLKNWQCYMGVLISITIQHVLLCFIFQDISICWCHKPLHKLGDFCIIWFHGQYGKNNIVNSIHFSVLRLLAAIKLTPIQLRENYVPLQSQFSFPLSSNLWCAPNKTRWYVKSWINIYWIILCASHHTRGRGWQSDTQSFSNLFQSGQPIIQVTLQTINANFVSCPWNLISLFRCQCQGVASMSSGAWAEY